MKHLSKQFSIFFILTTIAHQIECRQSSILQNQEPLLVVPELITAESQTSTTSQVNPYLQKILHALLNLPRHYQPTQPAEALKLIIRGSQVFKHVDKSHFYDACMPHNISSQSVTVLKTALNSSDANFWQIIETNAELKHEIEKCNVAYTRRNFISPNYNTLFRISYIRINIPSQDELLQFKHAYQFAIVALQWYLFGQAIIQDNVFTSGMITLSDPEFNIFQFLDGYTELVSPCYRFYSGLHPHSLWQTEGYTRKSSHWNGQKRFNDSNFGIDLKDEDGTPLSVLPGNKSHILFGSLNNGFTFIKWEEYGTTINFKESDYSAFRHTLRYFQKKNVVDNRLERREKTPQDILLQFRSLHQAKLNKQQSDDVSTYGIKAMLNILEEDAKEFFIKYLIQRKHYARETLQHRKGNEVLLQQPKFVSFT